MYLEVRHLLVETCNPMMGKNTFTLTIVYDGALGDDVIKRCFYAPMKIETEIPRLSALVL